MLIVRTSLKLTTNVQPEGNIPEADVRFLDTGHFALETHSAEIGAAMRDFLGRVVAR